MKRAIQQHFELYGTVYLSLLCVAAFLLPLLLRISAGDPITPGEGSYAILRQIDLVGYDHLNEEFLAPNPYTLILGVMATLNVPWLLPVILSIILIVLLQKYLLRYVGRKIVIFFALTAFILSPSMNILGTHHTHLLLGFIFVISSLLFTRLKYLFLVLGIITSPLLGFLALLYHFFSFLKLRNILLLVLTLAVSVTWFVFWSALPSLSLEFQTYLFEFGISYGVSVFFVLVAGYGFLSQYFIMKREGIFLLSAFAAASFFISELVIITTLILSVLVGYAIFDLLKTKWELDLLRHILTMLIVCLGLFLFIVLVRERVDENPSEEFAQLMNQLNNERHPGAVLSSPDYAPIIEYFSGRKATINDDSQLNRSFYSRDSETIYEFLEETETSYIFITDEMENSLFDNSEQGMLFLLPNTQRFVAVSRDEEATMWYYIHR